MSGAPELPWLLPAILLSDPDPDSGGPARPRRTVGDRIVDGLVLGAAALMAVFLAWVQLSAAGPTPEVVVDVIGGAFACAALTVRRRWPVAVALALAPVSLVSISCSGAVGSALVTVAVHRRLPVAAGVSVLHLATGLGFALYRPNPDMPFWGTAIVTVLLYTALLIWGLFIRARRHLVLSLRERAARAESEQRLRVAQARQLERARIAREMHDVLAHRISLLSVHAGALEYNPDAPPAEIARAAGVIRDSAHQALQDLREVIGVLRDEAGPDPDRPQPTVADLPALVEESRQAGTRVRLDCRAGPDVPPGIGRTAYRVVQEGLTNARKHAPGFAVNVRVDGGRGAGLTVEVRNGVPSGGGRAEIPGAGLGLVGLVERVHLAGGTLEHGRTGGEFALRAWLPWPG
ncbi:sensor histidine kinase [Bailinhaonella thermotolerans]|uniref:histidine kinase n=1 Tax=Bailinhaonella thermotolerans TaxID=1070861 RepID=A0A3A4A7Q9_9ACTN|nr:histidine kinase [Bailinhaonella thermotolerans]RJL23027.1 sensor histidine kinase [Bailinhaonella thermotolerans]